MGNASDLPNECTFKMIHLSFFTFSVNFYIRFFTGHSGGVAFAYSVQEEALSAGGEVALAFTTESILWCNSCLVRVVH